MKKILLTILLLSVSLGAFAFDIVKSTVVVPQNATMTEKYAADEFVKYIEKISGVKLPISTTPSQGSNVYINSLNSAEDDGINIKTQGNNLYFQGNNQRATIYSVYEFLEKYCNVEFYSKDLEIVPKKKFISVKNINYSYVPPFYQRECDIAGIYNYPETYVKFRMNCSWNLTDPKLGGSTSIIGGAHSVSSWIPEDKYFKDHPEYFALNMGERKGGKESQLCMTNKEVLEEIAKNVLETMEKYPDNKLVAITQNDNSRRCECEKCMEAYEKYGSTSGAYIEGVNYIADIVKEKRPDLYIVTFAYAMTVKPPKNITVRDNVVVRFCTIEQNASEPIVWKDKYAPYNKIHCRMLTGLNIDTANTDLYNYLQDWSKISSHLLIWDYISNFNSYYIPHPNIHVLQENMKLFREFKALGLFSEGDRSNDNATFNELKSYIIAKLQWNPEANVEALIEKFCDANYKKGSKDIQEIIKILENTVSDQHIYFPTYVHDMEWLSDEDTIKCIKLFQNALKKTKNEKFANEKINLAYQCFLYGWNNLPDDRYEKIKKACQLSYKNRLDFENPFTELMVATKNDFVSEGHNIVPNDKPYKTTKTGNVPDFCKGLKDEDWFELTTKDFEVTDKPSSMIEDPDAVTGQAIVYYPTNVNWCRLRHFGGNIQGFKKAGKTQMDIYISAKTKGKKTDKGNILQVGVYDFNVQAYRFEKACPISAFNDGEYTWYKVGTWDFQMTKAGSFYLTAYKNEGSCEEIYIDRMIGVVR